MILTEPDVVAVARQIRGIVLELFCLIAKRAVQDPSHMGPPLTVTRRVRVSPLIGISVVHAMNADPVDGPALEGKRTASSNAVLQPLRSSVSAVS